MKKTFIGLLLVAAAGAGIFFYLRKQKDTPAGNPLNKEWIAGTWRLDSLDFKNDSALLSNLLVLRDSDLSKQRYEFTKDGQLFISSGSAADSLRYEWINDELVCRPDSSTGAADSLKVSLLKQDSLIAMGRDSTVLYFTKAE